MSSISPWEISSVLEAAQAFLWHAEQAPQILGTMLSLVGAVRDSAHLIRPAHEKGSSGDPFDTLYDPILVPAMPPPCH